jgi:hypothetical protein
MSWLAAATLGSAALGYMGQQSANKASAASVKAQMDFQERMSNTSHVREVKDLRKAGLNPILSAGGSGASSPSGASYTAKNTLSSAADAVRNIPEKQLIKQQMNTSAAQAYNMDMNGDFNAAKTREIRIGNLKSEATLLTLKRGLEAMPDSFKADPAYKHLLGEMNNHLGVSNAKDVGNSKGGIKIDVGPSSTKGYDRAPYKHNPFSKF